MSRGSPTFTDTSRAVPLPGLIVISGASNGVRSGRRHIQSSSFLFGEHLRVRLSVRVEIRLPVFCPGCSLLCAADVPIWTAALQRGAQVEAQLFDGRSTE